MTDGQSLQERLVEIGLEDPFIRTIVGMVAVATAASFAVSIMGNATKAVFAVGLSMMFGVVLVVLRVLMKHADDKIVWTLCLLASGVIVLVFMAFIVVAVPAVTVCWPPAYSQTLGLRGCAKLLKQDIVENFEPKPYTGAGIKQDPANAAYEIRINYRAARQADAERVVGAFLTAGYKSQGVETNLNEVDTPDRSSGFTLIKTVAKTQALAPEIARITKLAMPLAATRVTLAAQPAGLSKGDAQIDLF